MHHALIPQIHYELRKRETLRQYQVAVTEKIQCAYCGSKAVDFVDYGRISRRLDEKKIAVTEIWSCLTCGKEFEHLGTLYSPGDLNHIRLRTAILTWCGYFGGSLLAYHFISLI